ncbi:MAG: hypothetical protein BAJALOKI1v1_1250010 [Promethearchaeota archaeon]|nr:MAG: hypothetical protein BAJALOKI1v1_1250010 [Candidatus Lokiarchaeota archaeon]
MPTYKFGLIGDNLDLKQNISFDINSQGGIINLVYEDCEDIIQFRTRRENYLMIPGFINSHVHIGDSFAKEKGYNQDLIDIVAPPSGLKHMLLRDTASNIILQGIQQAALEMISNGITFFIDFREGGVEGIKILKRALYENPINYHIYGRYNTPDEIEQVFKKANGLGLSSYKKLHDRVKNDVKTFKLQYSKLIACHHAEVSQKPTLFKKILDDGLVQIIIHGTHLSKGELKQLKAAHLSLVLCPRSNGYFGVGFPPIVDILDLKIPICLGSDNIMNNSPNLFEEMRYLYLIFKVLNKARKKPSLSASDLLKMSTINAARSFNIQNQVGSIKEGKQGDYFLIDLNEPNYYSIALEKDLIYPLIVQRTQSSTIKQVFIRGELVYERI